VREESLLLTANRGFLEVAAHAEHTLTRRKKGLSIGSMWIVAIHTRSLLHKMPMEIPFEFFTHILVAGKAERGRIHANLKCASISPGAVTGGAVAVSKGIVLIRPKQRRSLGSMRIVAGRTIRVADSSTFVEGDEIFIHVMAVQTNSGNALHQESLLL